MKINVIFVLFALKVIVVDAFLSAALRGMEPVILSVGAVFAAFTKVELPHHK